MAGSGSCRAHVCGGRAGASTIMKMSERGQTTPRYLDTRNRVHAHKRKGPGWGLDGEPELNRVECQLILKVN